MHRTYVRRRFVASALVIGVVFVGGGRIAAAFQRGERPLPVAERRVVVEPGDTLWAIAGALSPERDPRAMVDRIERRNGIEAGQLVPGQVVIVPLAG